MARRLLSLDVTGTLIRVRGSVGEIYSNAARDILGVSRAQADPVQLDKSFKNSHDAMVQAIPNFGSTSGMTSRQWWTEAISKTFLNVAIPLGEHKEKISNHLFDQFSTGSCWEAFPDTVPFLETAAQNHQTLAIVSNFDERLEGILADLDLLKYFDIFVVSRKVGHMKPSPLIFQLLIEKTGMEPKEIVHVGNSLGNDYLPPRELGMQSYLILRNPSDSLTIRTEGLDVISSLTDLYTKNLI